MPSKSHKYAERRRRERINGQLCTLRAFFPNITKTDKASLLAEVVGRVKKLKQLAHDVVTSHEDISGKEFSPIPNEKDDLVVEYYKDDESSDDSSETMIRISLSCEDRPDLLKDLIIALKKSAQGKVVKADLATIGGRMKSVILIQPTTPPDQGVEQGTRRTGGGASISTNAGTVSTSTSSGDVTTLIRRALKPVINKPSNIGFNKWFLYA